MAGGVKFIIIMQRLQQGASEFRESGTFTNDVPHICDIYRFTDQITVGGENHECVLAAKSPMFGDEGIMAITTTDMLVWIRPDGEATALNPAE